MKTFDQELEEILKFNVGVLPSKDKEAVKQIKQLIAKSLPKKRGREWDACLAEIKKRLGFIEEKQDR